MRRLPRYVLFLGAKFRTISFLHNTQKWVKKGDLSVTFAENLVYDLQISFFTTHK